MLGLVLTMAGPARSGQLILAVIVHPERRPTLTLDDLARIYLRKRRFWHDGTPIIPVNHEAGTVTREAFSRRVLGRTRAQLARYWDQRYFDGIFPPVTLHSDAAVREYVARDRNAIGYISSAAVDSSVHVALRLK